MDDPDLLRVVRDKVSELQKGKHKKAKRLESVGNKYTRTVTDEALKKRIQREKKRERDNAESE